MCQSRKLSRRKKWRKTTLTKNDVRTQLTTTTENDIQQRSRDGGKNNVKLDVSTLEKRRYNVTSDASYDVITWRDVGKNDVHRGVFYTTFKSSVAVENDVKISLHQPPMVLLIPKSWLVSLKSEKMRVYQNRSTCTQEKYSRWLLLLKPF